VIAWEMFTGQLPFDAKEPLEIALLHLNQPPPQPRSLRPDLPLALEAVLLKALAKAPEDRYQTGSELAAAIETAAVLPAASPSSKLSSTRKTIPQRVALDFSK
jgi:serine/threonine-protein kinase